MPMDMNPIDAAEKLGSATPQYLMGAVIIGLCVTVYWLARKLLDALNAQIAEGKANGALASQVAAALQQQAEVNRLIAARGTSN
jgi:hypothetical protein